MSAFLADWSLRFAALIVPVVLLFAARPPRAVAARLVVLRLTLLGGLLLPLVPRWWAAPELPTPARVAIEPSRVPIADGPRLEPPELLQVRPPVEPRVAAKVPSEPAAPEPAPAAVDWRRVIVGVWLLGCAVGLIRLLSGQWWLGRVRRRASAVDGEHQHEFDGVRAELGVRRAVELLMSREVTGPALFGGLCPAVVVPPGWNSLAPNDRRAVLLHELAHARGGDDWAGLAEGTVRAAFWFHPCVRWLLTRLACERESRCDAVAVAQGVPPTSLARVLLDGARRLGPGRSLFASSAVGMANRSSAAGRITQLLEADMATWTRPMTPARALLAAALVLGLGAGLGGYGARAQPPVPEKVEAEKPAAGPTDVKPGEFAGLIVGTDGKPLEGVKVHLDDWVEVPENIRVTKADGLFRFADYGAARQQFQVRFSKPGYSPVYVVSQPAGVKGLVVTLDSATYFEGTVRGPDGKPAPGAIVRADSGPNQGDGVLISKVWTQTVADANGHYRLYVSPDKYEFHVKAKGVGVARLPRTSIAHGTERQYDIALEPGITFRAKVVDSVTGKPAAGLRLFDWQQKGVDATSDAVGNLAIEGLSPGEFSFSVESKTYSRWWSETAKTEWQRKSIDDPATGWQRNFDDLTFELKSGMAPVTIIAEPAVTITGKVIDPDGKPVGGATAAPARTGSGNSLTGDTRFSTRTKPDGSFVMTLPASGAAEYNLVAHDGDYQEWRNWANGVLPPIKTVPGQKLDGVVLKLTRGGTVRGKVVDANGKPVAGREVQAESADMHENRYYDPSATTKADGSFELKFVRAGGQFVQVAPLWTDAREATPGTWKQLEVSDGEVVEGVELVASPPPEK